MNELLALALASEPGAAIPPGHLTATRPLELVRIDHTQADVSFLDEATRRVIGRPWPSVAIDVASRTVLGIYLAMALQTDAQTSSRFTPMELPRWSESEEFRRFLHAFEKVLPLKRHHRWRNVTRCSSCSLPRVA